MSVSFAGLIVCDVKVSEGRDRAVAQTLEVDEGAVEAPEGDEAEAVAVWPCLGAWR